VEDVSGIFDFDDDGISFKDVSGTVDSSTLSISGKIDGYTPDAPLHLRIESRRGELMRIPEHIAYMASLPEDARQIYELINPRGLCKLWAEVDRKQPGSHPLVSGELNVVDGAFSCKYFPYPIQGAAGKVISAARNRAGSNAWRFKTYAATALLGDPMNIHSSPSAVGWAHSTRPWDATFGRKPTASAPNQRYSTRFRRMYAMRCSFFAILGPRPPRHRPMPAIPTSTENLSAT